MTIDPKCSELAEHFLPDLSKDKQHELAEMIQWIVDLMLTSKDVKVETIAD